MDKGWEVIELKHLKKLKRGVLASTLLIVLTLSFAQIAFYDPVTMSSSFTIADQPDLPTRSSPGMVYDNESNLVVIFGGVNPDRTWPYGAWNSTWTYDYNSDSYTEMDPASPPLGRVGLGFAYDSIRDQVILFGGAADLSTINVFLSDTWLYDVDTDTWTEVFPASAPSGVGDMAFDSESDRVIKFGTGLDTVNETWAYDPGSNVWTEMSPATAPEGRWLYSMVYDSESDRVILFGGVHGSENVGSNYRADTWAYDFNSDTWEELTTTGSPSERGGHRLAYDSESDRVVLFGGARLDTSYNDTWLFDYNTLTWQDMNPTTSPSVRSLYGSAYDWESDRVIIYGGAYNGLHIEPSSGSYISNSQGKTWAYDVNTNTWERLNQGVDSLSTTTTTTTTTPTTTTNGGTTPPPINPVLIGVLGGIGVGVVIIAIVYLRRR